MCIDESTCTRARTHSWLTNIRMYAHFFFSHVFVRVYRIEHQMSSKVLKTEQLLSRISTQTRAAYTSLCALCVRSRLEVCTHFSVACA